MLPKFYHDPVFTVVEAAQVAGTSESAFRSMLHRGGAKYVGAQHSGRILFSCHELFIARIAAELSHFGMTGETIWQTAHHLAGGDYGPGDEPVTCFRVHRNDEGSLTFEYAYGAEIFDPLVKSHLVIPVSAIWQAVVDRAAEIYATAA